MQLKNLFQKKKELSDPEMVVRDMEMVDVWLQTQAPVYDLNFDVTVPVKPDKPEYLSKEELERFFWKKKKEADEFIGEHLYGVCGASQLYNIFQFVSLCMTTALQMVYYAPGNVIRSFVNHDEAESYYEHVYLKTEDLCRQVGRNIGNMFILMYGLDPEGERRLEAEGFLRYENGIQKIRYCGELKQCRHLLEMMAECTRYTEYLFSICRFIYENVPVIVDDEGNYMRIPDWSKVLDRIQCHISIENLEHKITTSDDFLNLVMNA